ncbi:RAMP superfamily CRISPR-associated protein [Ruminococcus sp. HUN007]|uniref:RAMP superfamily CRISPR-associated protein n=1 Tax=Ruminococcus sp. HUN007 TaxID=1514668 RepID=UPI0009E06602|nr:RAMP superfamily CRISPR-associated protein [Ruminococcus sp. HUN007]
MEIMKHTYYRLQLKLTSPLSVGSGENRKSDSDVITRLDGSPYIPATTIAGVLGHWFDIEKRRNIFGFINGNSSESSHVIFYDADLDKKSFVKVRDSVALKNKVAIKNAKFDFQVIEPGAEFVTIIELTKENEILQSDIEKLAEAVSSSALRFGRKTNRGYGIVEISRMQKAEFDFSDPKGKKAWLEFDPLDNAAWNEMPIVTISNTNEKSDVIKICLEQNGPLSIREYTTEIGEVERIKDNGEKVYKAVPDYRMMKLRNGEAVIPGTTWAGAFRSRFEELSDIETTKALFGYVITKSQKTMPSKIIFSESTIKNNTKKIITRTAIDRFTSGAQSRALYTEETCCNGTTSLLITIPKNTDEKKQTLTLCSYSRS